MINVSPVEIFSGLGKGMWAGLAIMFAFVWVIFKMFWWLWVVLIIFYLFKFFGFYRSRRTFFHFPHFHSKRYSTRETRAETYIGKKGYEKFSNDDKLVHREEAEKELGRNLRPGEVVHHIDGDKLNNDPDNLAVLPNQDTHDRIHGYDKTEDDYEADYEADDDY